jgi:hypothetical protein
MRAAFSAFSQRPAFRRSTSIARRRGHKSIWATRSVLVFAPPLLRLGSAAIGSYWSLPSTEYRSGPQKMAQGSLQPSWHLLLKGRFPAKIPTSLAVGTVGPFWPRFRRESSYIVGRSQAVGGGCRSGVGSQGRRRKGFSGFRYRWRLNRFSSPGARRSSSGSWFIFFSQRCRIKFRLAPVKPNILSF